MGSVVPVNRENLLEASRLLGAGALVCFPTETVYGVGADASNPAAVRRIFEAKGRPADHPLIVHLPNAQQMERWAAEVPDRAHELARRFWPGPLTLVLKRAADVPGEVTGGQATVALRVPAHPVARELLEIFGGGVAAPSANRFGRVSPTLARHAAQELGDRVAMVLDGGPCDVGVESSILDLSGERPRLLRPGGVPRKLLEESLGMPLAPASTETDGAETDGAGTAGVGTGGAGTGGAAAEGDGAGDAEGDGAGDAEGTIPRVPGSLPGHYAPASPLFLLGRGDLEERLRREDSPVTVLARSARPQENSFPEVAWQVMPDDAEEYGRRLYAALREADDLGRPILVEAPPDDPEWEAVNDRLRRADQRLRGAGIGGTRIRDGDDRTGEASE